jgi:hypothetical protein
MCFRHAQEGDGGLMVAAERRVFLGDGIGQGGVLAVGEIGLVLQGFRLGLHLGGGFFGPLPIRQDGGGYGVCGIGPIQYELNFCFHSFDGVL